MGWSKSHSKHYEKIGENNGKVWKTSRTISQGPTLVPEHDKI